MNLDDIPTGVPLTVGQFAAALAAGAELHAPWEEPPPIARLDVPLAQLDADLQMLHLKREAAEAVTRNGIKAEIAHLLYDADAGSATRPFTYLGKGISARLIDGGQS